MDSAWQDQEGLGRPLVSDAEVARFVADRFGLPIAGIKPLAGERDLNFLATAADGRRYVVKVANANEAREQLEWEQAAMRHVAEAREGGALALQTQAPVALADGSGGTVARLAGSSAQGGGAGAAGAAPAQYYVRVLTYLEGAMWSASDLAVDFLASLGRAAAALDAALEGFGRPASGAGPAPTHAWDLGACQATVRGYLADIDAEADRALLLRFCALHEAVVAPLQARGQLPRSVVHQDLNDNNVVCAEGRVVGVIDFGDMCETETVNNLAVALAYAFFGRRAARAPLALGPAPSSAPSPPAAGAASRAGGRAPPPPRRPPAGPTRSPSSRCS